MGEIGTSVRLRGSVLRFAPDRTSQSSAGFDLDEQRALSYLHLALDESGGRAIRELFEPAPGLNANVEQPYFRLKDVDINPSTGVRTIKFEQAYGEISVFGSLATVELGAEGDLISLDAQVAPIEEIFSGELVSPATALDNLAQELNHATLTISRDVPRLVYFYNPREDQWRLTYLVPAEIPFLREGEEQEGRSASLQQARITSDRRIGVFVEAHSGMLAFDPFRDPELLFPSNLMAQKIAGATESDLMSILSERQLFAAALGDEPPSLEGLVEEIGSRMREELRGALSELSEMGDSEIAVGTKLSADLVRLIFKYLPITYGADGILDDLRNELYLAASCGFVGEWGIVRVEGDNMVLSRDIGAFK